MEHQCVYMSKKAKPAFSWKTDSCFDKKYGFICEHIKKDSNQLDSVTNNTLTSKESEKIKNYTSVWEQFVQKALRKTQISIATEFFYLENLITKIQVDVKNKV